MRPDIWTVIIVITIGGMLAVGIDKAITIWYHKGSKDDPDGL